MKPTITTSRQTHTQHAQQATRCKRAAPSITRLIHTTLLAITFLATITLWAPAAIAQTDEGVSRILLDSTLTPHHITLLEVVENGIVYIQDTGLVRSASFSDFAALYQSDTSLPLNPRIELTDGQRFTGTPTTNTQSTDNIHWTNPVFGTMSLSLDHVQRIVLDPTVNIQHANTQHNAPTEDRLLLRNGDVLTGFIESFSDTANIDAGQGIVQIPLDRLAQAHFANQPQERTGPYIWLADGTVVRVGPMQTSNSIIQLTRPANIRNNNNDTQANTITQQHAFPLSTLVALVPDASTLHPLASRPFTQQSTTPQRRWTPQPVVSPPQTHTLDAPDILMPGPMRLQWSLPEQSHTIRFDAQLPRRSLMWGDCNIVVHAIVKGQDVPIARAHLSADTPTTSIHALFPANADAVAITLEPGRFGPAQDAALLQNAFIRTDK